MSRHNLAALAGVAGLVLAVVPAGATTPAPAAPAIAPPPLTITTNGTGAPTVASGIVGGNQRWLQDADHAWDQQAEQVRPAKSVLWRAGTPTDRPSPRTRSRC